MKSLLLDIRKFCHSVMGYTSDVLRDDNLKKPLLVYKKNRGLSKLFSQKNALELSVFFW